METEKIETTGNDFDTKSMIEALSSTDNNNVHDFQVPEEIAGLKAEEWGKGLSSISGGKITDINNLRDLMSKAEGFEKTKADHISLQEKIKAMELANQNLFANDYVKQLNELYKNESTTPEEIALFVKMQSLDLKNTSDIDALKLQLSMQYPELSKSQVEAAFEKEYGEEADWSEGDKALIAKKAIDARKELGKIQYDSRKPESLKNQEQQRAAQEQTFNYWKEIENTVGVQDSFKISEKLDNDKLFEFEFKLPEGAIDKIKNARMWHLMNGAVKRGDAETYKKEMAAFTEQYIYANYGKEMMSAALKHNASTTKLEADRKHHNVGPTLQGKDMSNVNASALEKELDKFREKV